MSMNNYLKITSVLKSVSSAVGFCIALGKKFFESGVHEIDNDIMPFFKSKADATIHPRVLPSYGMLLWFSLQVIYYSYYKMLKIASYD